VVVLCEGDPKWTPITSDGGTGQRGDQGCESQRKALGGVGGAGAGQSRGEARERLSWPGKPSWPLLGFAARLWSLWPGGVPRATQWCRYRRYWSALPKVSGNRFPESALFFLHAKECSFR